MSKWDRYGLDQAKYQARESKDPSSQVGACILRPNGTVASMGWNGLPQGVADTPERLNDRETKLALVIHAEVNALLKAKEDLTGYTIYVWPFPPCAACASQLIQAGIKRVVFPAGPVPPRWTANFALGHEVLAEAGVRYDCKPVDGPAFAVQLEMLP